MRLSLSCLCLTGGLGSLRFSDAFVRCSRSVFEITRCPTPPGRLRPCARSRETAPPRGRRSEGLGLPGKSTGEVSSGGLLRSRPATREAPNTRGVRPDPSAWPAGPVPSHRRPGPLGFRPGCGLSPGLCFPTRHPVCRGAHHPPPVPAAGPPQGSAAANPPRTPQSRHRSPAGLGAPSATHLIHALCLLRQKPHFSEEPRPPRGATVSASLSTLVPGLGQTAPQFRSGAAFSARSRAP